MNGTLSAFHSLGKRVALCAALCLATLAPLRAQTFTEVTTDGWGPGIDQPSPCVLDIDGDGLLDILLGMKDQAIWHYEQTVPGSLQFTLVTRRFAGLTGYAQPHVTAGDLDGDGRIDLLIGQNSGTLLHYEQVDVRGADFIKINDSFSGFDVGAHAVPCLTDFNGDGLLDLIVVNSSGICAHFIQPAAASSTSCPARRNCSRGPIRTHPYS
ncbi:MAG: VCBS repeat-containing protein [Ignavibacteria bacterium]|nr:VCBS repeat-containing protein [Ignavibacteria bacterium]